jgi:hypothetical protein
VWVLGTRTDILSLDVEVEDQIWEKNRPALYKSSRRVIFRALASGVKVVCHCDGLASVNTLAEPHESRVTRKIQDVSDVACAGSITDVKIQRQAQAGKDAWPSTRIIVSLCSSDSKIMNFGYLTGDFSTQPPAITAKPSYTLRLTAKNAPSRRPDAM